jgi:hypothetical protein
VANGTKVLLTDGIASTLRGGPHGASEVTVVSGPHEGCKGTVVNVYLATG